MDTIHDLVRDYMAIWNESDPVRRRATVDAVFTEDCGYTDPNVVLAGRDAIDQFIGVVRKRLTGVVFTVAGEVDHHHDQARFAWHAGPAGAEEPLVAGFDVAVLDGGRISRLYGFLDKVPG